VSETAMYGGLTAGPKVIDDHVKENMRKIVERVRDGSFAKEWVEECASGKKRATELMKAIEAHLIERVGRELRKLAGIES